MTVPPSSSRPFPRSKLLHIHQRRISIRRREEMNGIAMLSRRCRGGESVSLVLFIFSVRSREVFNFHFMYPTRLYGRDVRCGVLLSLLTVGCSHGGCAHDCPAIR